ncbi:MAG: chitobiase/beta-hexosaminidase C-terminal domain-containing protein, partial [Ruminiclostridium sp.]|nr:chitobiase/beta-hexosaminidase C-terminal domain-containing protein [Ruminiclostridium sp.]
MSTTLKRITAIALAFFTLLTALVLSVPASASTDTLIKYSVKYSGNYVYLTLKPQNSGNTIYYSTNGKNPTKKSKVYKKKLVAKSKVNVIALEYNKSGKLVASINIVMMPKVKSPVFSLSTDPAGNKYVTITSATSGAKIYYTTDGSKPNEKS